MVREDNEFIKVTSIDDMTWNIKLKCPFNCIYANEVYNLYVKFDEQYPMQSPEIKFLLPAPMHTHVYSNGHICLNILYADWTPALTVHSVCLSLISMLSSASCKEVPSDNALYVARVSHDRNPKQTRFVYDDDTV